MRVGIISLQHESNTFIQSATTLADFEYDVLATGDEIYPIFKTAAHEIGGFFAGLAEAGIEAVPIFVARALPGGTITAETVETLVQKMLQELQQAGPLDGLLVAPHGAGVSENERDLDGYWLKLVRQQVGAELPIVCTLDAHANVSQTMIDACDATIVYRTNPHIDQKDRGMEAARLMQRILKGEVKPTQAACFVPVAINIERQHTSSEPCASLYKQADQILQEPSVLSNSVILGFPYADVEEMGSGFIVVTDNDASRAQQLADQLGESLINRREEFVAQLISIENALDQAEQLEGPICFLDMGDNIGGGSPADGTTILHAIQQRQGPKSFACLYDPAAAQQAISAGPGATLSGLAMGGKTDDQHGTPLVADVTVLSVHDGFFTESQVRHGGKTEYQMGPTAVVQTDFGLTLMLNSHRTPPFSLGQLTSCGINPADFQILVAKGVQAPLAAYSPVCPNLIRVNTPGVTSADMEQFEYQYRRRPLFPFEPIQ
ncbi:MAG: M81 family metallopeptidase [Planctomycetota bacterium]